MSAPHPLHIYESIDGDMASVRYKDKRRAHYSYMGPSGKDGVHLADTSGRDSVDLGDFRAIYPKHVEDCCRCETLFRWGQRRGGKP